MSKLRFPSLPAALLSAGLLSLATLASVSIAAAQGEKAPEERGRRAAEQRLARVEAPPQTRRLRLEEALRRSLSVQIDRAHLVGHSSGSGPCAGNFTADPTAVLTLNEPAALRVGASARNGVDMTLAILHPNGAWTCFDDSHEGNDPSGLVAAEAGELAIYAGSYAPRQTLDFMLSVESAERVEWERCERSANLSVSAGTDALLEGRILNNLAPCDWVLRAPTCLWQISEAPIACVDIEVPLALTLRTEGASFDTVLVALPMLPDGTVGEAPLLNDDADSERTTSELQFLAAPGRYAVFVGSYRHLSDGTYHVRVQASVPEVSP